jgi:hypothetical protein
MELHTAPPGDAWRLGRGPFVFAGQPPLLAGELDLLSTTEEKVRVRGVDTTGGDDPESMRAYGMGVLRTAARLRPGERARVAAHFMVNPSTPPGTYRTELVCGEQHEDVVVHVFPRQSVRLLPSPVRFAAAAGEVVSRDVVVRNRGNLAQPVPDVALVFLEERDWVNRSLVFALRETSEDEGHQRYLDRVVSEVRASLVNPARVKVTVNNGAELPPGETMELRLEIRMPSELTKGRSYFGSTDLVGGRLGLEVKCTKSRGSRQRRATP